VPFPVVTMQPMKRVRTKLGMNTLTGWEHVPEGAVETEGTGKGATSSRTALTSNFDSGFSR